MMLDPVLLSRLQFFWVISFHILLPAFTVGLACYIAVLESLYLKTRDHAYFRVSVFWTKIFAVSFGLGVVSGIVMPFQFGTNWSRFSDAAANVIGPLMAYEGLWDDRCCWRNCGFVFAVEVLSDGCELTKLELGEGQAAPALGGAHQGAEHQLQHRLLAEPVRDDLQPTPLLDEQSFEEIRRACRRVDG